MLKAFRKTNSSVGLHVMPIIPYITDSYENLDSICAHAQQANVHYMLPGTLYLRGKTRKYFLDFAEMQFPAVYKELLTLYKTGGANKPYKDHLYQTVNGLRDKYNLSSSYSKPMREKMHKE